MSKKCPNCGAELEDNAVFCDECGVQLAQQSNHNPPSTPPIVRTNVSDTSAINLQSMVTPKASDGMKNSGLGIASMVLGIISVCSLGILFIPKIVGLILGIITMGKKDTKHTFAVVGIVTSAIAFVLVIVIMLMPV